jgi:hypothetical protein
MNDAKNHDSQQGMDAQGAKTNARRQPMAETSMQAYPESGGDQGNQDDEDLNYAELLLKAKSILRFLWPFKFLIIGIGLLFALGGYFKVKMAKPIYAANLTFALEQGTKGGSLSGLASSFGISMGGGGEGLGGENLLTLMKSRRIVQDVLLTPVLVGRDSVLLINQYVRTYPDLKEAWDSAGLYPITASCCSNAQDSALGVVIYSLTEKALGVSKIDKEQSFVTVSYAGHDPVFTGAFVELLTAKSTDFYVQTKMSNSNANIAKLERRVDSVSAEMQAAMVGFASAQDQNSFTVQSVAKVPSAQKQMKVTMLTTLYGELVKNLELSKTMMAREEPLITIIDRPHYPLRVRESKLKSAIIGGFLGVFLTLLFLGGRAFLSDLNKQAAAIQQNA